MDIFKRRHPLVPLCLLLSILLLAMFAQSPRITVPALAGAVLFLCTVRGSFTVRSVIGYLLCWALIAAVNPLFSTGGATPLVFVAGRPYTREALLYGVHLGAMLLAVLLWFRCERLLIPEEHRFFLFGRFAPKLALLISSVLRFVPLLKRRATAMRDAQTAVGVYGDPDWIHRAGSNMTTMSALTTWSLEHAVDTGAAMKARGYGLPGRTTYRTYRFTGTDAAWLSAILVLTASAVLALARGGLGVSFYPNIVFAHADTLTRIGVAAYTILCLLPFLSAIKEELRWCFYRSKM